VKVTKAQLKKIIKEEFSRVRKGRDVLKDPMGSAEQDHGAYLRSVGVDFVQDLLNQKQYDVQEVAYVLEQASEFLAERNRK
tara:strand:- start:97 stop:339 length:243 start_codon:yes stop_codon:yes gene_type:complete